MWGEQINMVLDAGEDCRNHRYDSSGCNGKWALRPDFHLRPPQSHEAVVWWLAQFVTYHIRGQRRISLSD